MRQVHPYYDGLLQQTRRVRDVLAGSDEVKKHGQLYLRKPPAMTVTDYEAYLHRAHLLPVADRALSGLVGIALAKDPIVQLPQRLVPLIERATYDGKSLDSLTEWLVRETLSIGHSCLLLDLPADNADPLATPYIATYRSESILDWREEVRDGKAKLVYLKLHDNIASDDEVERHVILEADPIYTVRWMEKTGKDEFVQAAEYVPSVNGRAMTEIPAVFCSPYDLTPTPSKPPFLDLVDTVLSHFQNSADLEHILFLCSAPTAILRGSVSEKDKPNAIGPSVIWNVPSDGDASWMEVQGGGIAHLRSHMKEKEMMIAAIAARFIYAGINRNEAPETARLRVQGELSVLRGTIRSVELAMMRLLRIAAEWTNSDPSELRFEMFKDLAQPTIDPKEMAEMTKAVLGGVMSFDTYYRRLQEGGVFPRDRTAEDEQELIETDGGGLGPQGT